MYSREFFRFISPEHLYFVASIFSIITIIIVAMIYTFLYIKKRRFRVKNVITDKLNDWISEELTEGEVSEFNIPKELATHFKKKYIRQFLIDNLINIKKNVTGSIAENVITLYEFIGLKDDSERRMKSLQWHNRARGIYELYMMHQRESLSDILEYTNSDNEYVRMEAQTAIIGFDGFRGLVFLDSLTYPMYEWQQIKLLEQLNAINSEEMPHLPLWLHSENRYVVQFALKLTEIYQQFHVHDDVLPCLNNENHKIRFQAIKTLGSIAESNTVAILREQYPKEPTANKLEILRQVGIIGTTADIDFLTANLNEEDHALKLEAGRAMVSINRDRMDILDQISENDEIIHSITQQIKYEVAQ